MERRQCTKHYRHQLKHKHRNSIYKCERSKTSGCTTDSEKVATTQRIWQTTWTEDRCITANAVRGPEQILSWVMTCGGDFTLGATPMAKYYVGGKKPSVFSVKNEGPFSSTPHTLSEKYYAGCWRNVHFRHGISFCTPGSALEKNASDIMLLLCGDYAGISDADLSFLRDPGLCGEHPGVISYILCTGVDGFFLLLCGVEAKRTPPGFFLVLHFQTNS